MKNVFISLVLIYLVMGIAGCGGSSGGGSNPVNTVILSGTTACPDEAGVFMLTFDCNNDSVVAGTLDYNGETYTLSGNYDAGTGSLNAQYSGPDPHFVLTGTFETGTSFVGQMVRTIASVETTCTISGQEETDEGSVENYLGTFGFDSSDSDAGTWNMSIQNGVAVGTYARNTTVVRGTFSGTVSGSTLTVDTFYVYDSGTDTFYDLYDVFNPPITGSASGTFSGSAINGSWEWDYEGTGLFTGTLQ